MEFDGGGLDDFEAPGKHLVQGVVNSKRATILHDDVAKLCKGPALCEPKHFESHCADKPRGHGAHECGKVGLSQLVVEGFVGNRGIKQRMEAAVEIRQGFDMLACTGRRQRQPQAKRRDSPPAPTTLCGCAASVEPSFGKHPLELVRDHAKLSMIHLGLL